MKQRRMRFSAMRTESHVPPQSRVSPDFTSFIASSIESHIFEVLGGGMSVGTLYFLTRPYTDIRKTEAASLDEDARATSIMV
jgi:hypothetical protein